MNPKFESTLNSAIASFAGRCEMPYFDRFDICFAYEALENDWHHGGILQNRPSNRRRREATAVQLRRIGFYGGMHGGTFDRLSENQRDIYVEALARFGMIHMLSWADYSHRSIMRHIKGEMK